MISSLLKMLMKECGLTQSALADVMGVSLDRVKSLTAGKVKNLRLEEADALIQKLQIRSEWLATGEGPMRQGPGEQEVTLKLQQVKAATSKAAVPGLSREDSARLAEILFFLEAEDAAGLGKVLNPGEPAEQALLGSYRSCSPEAQIKLIQIAAVLAAGLPLTDTQIVDNKAGGSASVKTNFSGTGAVVNRSILGFAFGANKGKTKS